MTAKNLKLDHFQIYDVANENAPYSVSLKGQFDNKRQEHRLLALTFFANPVRKNDERIYDRQAHLTCYRFQQSPEPRRAVWLNNQFGKQKIYTGNAELLLSPAKKYRSGGTFPKKLDHYKVYRVIKGKSINRTVKLRDQFGKSKVKVLTPYGFAVPVKKRHDGKTYPIHNKKAHLVLYRITPYQQKESIVARDQFGKYKLKVFWSILLAVPSRKIKWKKV